MSIKERRKAELIRAIIVLLSWVKLKSRDPCAQIHVIYIVFLKAYGRVAHQLEKYEIYSDDNILLHDKLILLLKMISVSRELWTGSSPFAGFGCNLKG